MPGPLRRDEFDGSVKNKPGLRRLVLGSVAEAVVRTAPSSVLVVRLQRRS